MPRAMDERLELNTRTDIKRADAFRAVELVARYGQEIDTQLSSLRGDFSHRLGGIGVEDDSMLASDTTDIRDGLSGANFVIGVHHGNQDRGRRHRALHIVGVDSAEGIHRQVRDLSPNPFQKPAGIDDRGVLDLRRDDMGVCIRLGEEDSFQCVIVRFASTAREDNLAGFTPQEVGDLRPRRLNGFPRGLPRPVIARRIAERRK
jgi:hypothetical protein